jgi:hypothetical protein
MTTLTLARPARRAKASVKLALKLPEPEFILLGDARRGRPPVGMLIELASKNPKTREYLSNRVCDFLEARVVGISQEDVRRKIDEFVSPEIDRFEDSSCTTLSRSADTSLLYARRHLQLLYPPSKDAVTELVAWAGFIIMQREEHARLSRKYAGFTRAERPLDMARECVYGGIYELLVRGDLTVPRDMSAVLACFRESAKKAAFHFDEVLRDRSISHAGEDLLYVQLRLAMSDTLAVCVQRLGDAQDRIARV